MDVELLRNVAVTAFASEALEAETWQKMAALVAKDVNDGVDFVAIESSLKEIEREMKQKYDVASMPAAWRSAKSVCLSALAKEVGLLTLEGEAKGKTQVEREIKSAACLSLIPDPVHAYLQRFDEAYRAWNILTESERSRVAPAYRWEQCSTH